MQVRIIVCLLTLLYAFTACGQLKYEGVYTPPTVPFGNGVLVSLEGGCDLLAQNLPASFTQTACEVSAAVLTSGHDAMQLCLHGPEYDTLYRYYRWKLFREDVFERCYGRWSEDAMLRTLNFFDSVRAISRDSVEVFSDTTFQRGYAEFLTAAESLQQKWAEVLSRDSRIRVVTVSSWGIGLLDINSKESIEAVNLHDPSMSADMFALWYSSLVIPANYSDKIRSGRYVYVRYFSDAIQLVFPTDSADHRYYREVTVVLNQKCRVDEE
jgi:hypothetical protein